jgi:hypothetical protein
MCYELDLLSIWKLVGFCEFENEPSHCTNGWGEGGFLYRLVMIRDSVVYGVCFIL